MSPEVEIAIGKLVSEEGMTDADLRDLLGARSLGDVQDLMVVYAAAGRPLDRTARQKIAAVFGAIVHVAQEVAPLVGFLLQLAPLL